MKGGEHEVSGHSSMNGGFGRFRVADLADKNNVRVLSQNRSQDTRERQTGR